MKRLPLLFAALGLITSWVMAEDKPSAGIIHLFNGKTLEGWKVADYTGTGKVEVRDGAILMEKGKALTGAVSTRKDLPKIDYETTFEGQKLEGEDFFCTATFPVADSFCSLVVGGWGGTLVGLSSLDSQDASQNDTTKYKEFKTNQWYKFRIRVTANRIEAWIDGEKLVDADTTDRRVSTRLESKVCTPYGFATYNTVGAVRDVRLRVLTEAEKKEAAKKPKE